MEVRCDDHGGLEERYCLGATTVVGGALEVFGCIWCGVIVLGGVVKMQCDCHGGLGERRLGFCLR